MSSAYRLMTQIKVVKRILCYQRVMNICRMLALQEIQGNFVVWLGMDPYVISFPSFDIVIKGSLQR